MLRERLTELLEPVVNDLGYELVLIEFSPHKGGATLRLFIDGLEGETGVRLEDCEKVSREVAATLDVEDLIAQSYRLEVSSPGLDRPLVKPAHFSRFKGEAAKVELLAPRDGRRRFKGRIVDADAQSVALETEEGRFVLPLADIERARLIPNFAASLGKTG